MFDFGREPWVHTLPMRATGLRGAVILGVVAGLMLGVTPPPAGAAPTSESGTYTFSQLVASVPMVEPLYVGYTGVEQFIPPAVALRKDSRGCDLRQRMIISLAAIKPVVSKKCRMKGGTWLINGGRTTVRSARGLVLQPVMSYKSAWGQGAYAWTPQQRLAWATDATAPPRTRSKAVTNQSTQGLYDIKTLKRDTAFANGPALAGLVRTVLNVFGAAALGGILDSVGEGLPELKAVLERCQALSQVASNAKAWGLSVDAGTWSALSASGTACEQLGRLTVEDKTRINGISPVSGITVVPTTATRGAGTSSAGVQIFDGYGTAATEPIAGELFGLHTPVGYGTPAVTAGYVRVWDSDASWRDLEPSKGEYQWDALSASIANAGGAKVMYVLGNTPGWANDGKDGSAPPNNLQDAADFIGAVCKKFGGQIASYEVWNEGNLLTYWSGSMAALADLTAKVRDAVVGCGSGAQVVASSAGARADGGFATRFKDYLTELGKGSWPVNAYAVHSYPRATGSPRERIEELGQFKAMLALTGAPVKPLYDTELNYGLAGLNEGRVPIDDTTGAAWLSQTFIDSVQYGVDSAFWYLWSRSDYQLLGVQLNPSTPQTIQAWATTRSWLIGSQMQRCSRTDTGTVFGCQLTAANGAPFTLLWASGTSSNAPVTVDVTGLGSTCQTLLLQTCAITTTDAVSTVSVGAQPVRILGG